MVNLKKSVVPIIGVVILTLAIIIWKGVEPSIIYSTILLGVSLTILGMTGPRSRGDLIAMSKHTKYAEEEFTHRKKFWLKRPITVVLFIMITIIFAVCIAILILVGV